MLDPAKSGDPNFISVRPAQKTFPVIPTDNEIAQYYDESVYKMASIVSILAYIIDASCLLLFLLAIFARKLIGIETVAVVQISFLSLITIK